MLRTYRDLYAGGFEFKLRAQHYLQQRQKEPGDIYLERLRHVFYENYIGSIVDWYGATLFRREPSLQFEGGLEYGPRHSCRSSSEDCDLRGTQAVVNSFAAQSDRCAGYWSKPRILIDFPVLRRQPARNRAEEDAIGLVTRVSWCATARKS